MSDLNELDGSSTPWHLWVVGIVALIWSSGGAFDYVMTQTQNEAYMSNFSAEQLEFFYGFPGWVVAAWAIAVWGEVLGAVLLLLRRGEAVWAFLASLLFLVITMIHNFGMSNGMEIMGSGAELAFTGAIFIVAVLLFLYARAMRDRKVLS